MLNISCNLLSTVHCRIWYWLSSPVTLQLASSHIALDGEEREIRNSKYSIYWMYIVFVPS